MDTSKDMEESHLKKFSSDTKPDNTSIKMRSKLLAFLNSVNLKYVKLGYHYLITHALYLLMTPLLVVIAAELSRMRVEDYGKLWEHLRVNHVSVLVCSGLLVFGSTLYILARPRPVYLVDFSCCKPGDMFKVTRELFMSCSRLTGCFNEKSLEFQKKMLERSGLGQDTYFPPAVVRVPPNPNMQEARREAESVMFAALDELFFKTGVKPREVGILVVNCSLFNPTPSLSAIIVSRYKMRSNIKSFNLGGMGCSAGIIAIELAKDLLQIHRNTYVVVVSTENITLNWYMGNDRSKMLSNCLFRMGAAAILLTNKTAKRRRAKYKLMHTVRTHKGADPKCFSCVVQEEDDEGKVGVTLSRDLMTVAGDALKANITTLGPRVLPLSEQILFLVNLLARKFLHLKVKPYIPDFKLAFEHFCIHAGGRAVLDVLEKNLGLSEWHMEPSRMTLYRFGNTSSSSLWYELAYTEAKGRVRRGDRLWQIAFGSGFKCNSAVWRALRTVRSAELNPWAGEIDDFPVEVPTCASVLN